MPTQLRAREIPVAIIGMACRLPGADGLDEFWQLVREGASAIRELPADRLDQELYYDAEHGTHGKSYCKMGALCASRAFHPDRCPLPEELLRASDPVHLLMCEVAADACRHAHLDPFNLPWRNTGVYVGNTQGSPHCGDAIYSTSVREAAQFLSEVNEFCQLPAHDQNAVIDGLVERIRGDWFHRQAGSPDVSTSMIAGLISKAFALTGPYVAVNSACASSLQAMLMAVRALQLGRIEMAIVGGASDCKGDTLTLFSAAQSLSASDSRPFDAQADGMICGEGYVALVLKTLPQALADNDPIQAIIRGIGVSSDGRGKSLWAPRKEGQILAMQRAYASPEEMSRLGYIEAHATSTQVGDATELSALAHVLRHIVPKGTKIPIGSVKANIGHALEAAGVASLIKTILCLQNRTIPPAINVRALNPNIDWDDAPLLVPQVAAPWPAPTDDSPRRAAVNAFGIGGLNVHVVIDEFSEPQRTQMAVRWRSPGADASSPSRDADSVAIIGIGCILPGALDRASYWDLIRSGRDPKSHAPPKRWQADLIHRPGTKEPCSSPITLGGFVTDFQYDWRRHKVPPKQIEQADPLQFMLLDAADQALADAGYGDQSFDRTRTGVIVGTEVGGDFAVQLQMGLRIPHMHRVLHDLLAEKNVRPDRIARICQQFGDVLLAHWPALLDETGSFTTSTLASRMTKTFDLMGGAAAVDSGFASSQTALMVCAEMLLAGDCDLMLCAAGHRRMGLAAYEALSASGQLTTSGAPRAPFDAHPNGLVPAEGAAVLLLKRLSDAQRDGDRIHAIVESVGVAHAAATGQSVHLAVERCLSAAGVAPNQVAMIETVGCGNSDGDQEELRGLLASYDQSGRSQPLLLSSVTAQIGHAGGASGMASLIRAGLQLANGLVGPTCGLEQPLELVQRRCDVVHPSQPARPIRASDGRYFASLSSCSKGLAYHILLARSIPLAVQRESSGTRPARKAVITKSPQRAANALRIGRIGAASWPQLAHEARRASENVDSFWLDATSRPFSPDDNVRLAIVADSAESFSQKLQLAAEQFDGLSATDELERRGIFARQRLPRRPRVAFVFPGQGSHYQGMIQSLVQADPHAATALRTLDAALSHHGLPNFAQMAWGDRHQLGRDIGTSQLAMLAADWIMFQTLLGRGVRPDVVLGHSFGEFAALTAAGVWTLEDAIRATAARVDGIRQSDAKDGGMLAIAAAPATVRRLMHQITEPVYVANHNSPQQTVVGGSRGALEQLAAVLQAQSCPHEFLPVPCAFHTPLMEGAAGKLSAALEHIRLSPPRIPLLSSVTNRYVAEPERIRENLVVQLTTPVRYMELVDRLVAEDPTILIEVGPNNILTRIHRRILAGRESPGIAATDGLKIGPVVSILRVQALLECLGVHESIAPDKATYAPTPSPPGEIVSRRDERPEVIHFDATRRRRDKLHESGSAQSHRRSVKANDRAAPAASGPSDQASDDNNKTAPIATDIAPQSAALRYGDRANNRAQMRSIATHVATSPQVADMPAAATERIAPVALERFLVNFVVEQTGYPPDVVDLDADLEADLGIDSIKKAQMFGELQEYFDVTPSEDLTLDDFPTLRHVLDFLRTSPSKRTLPDVVVAATDTPAAADTARDFLPEPAPLRTSRVATRPRNAIARASATATSTEQLKSFLVNFVVEQTGYPPDVVDLDADLEADLGIDSIKKAQMFGELQEYFDVTPSEDLTLDDFPTLRHVLDFLRDVPARKRILDLDSTASDIDLVTAVAPAAPLEPTRATTTDHPQPSAVTHSSGLTPEIQPEHTGPDLVLRGNAYQMGYQHGTQKRAEILDILRRYADRTDPLPIPEGVIEHPQRCFSEDDLAELAGLANAVGVPQASLIFHNLALAADLGDSPFSVAPSRDGQTQAGMNHRPSVAIPAQSRLRQCVMPLLQVRWPNDGHPQRVYSFVGGIGGIRRLLREQYAGVPAGEVLGTSQEYYERFYGPDVGQPTSPRATTKHDTAPDAQLVPSGRARDAEDQAVCATKRITQRMVLEMVPASEIPNGELNKLVATDSAVIVGSPADAKALRDRLEAAGAQVHDLSVGADPETAVAEFDVLWDAAPVTHLFIMTARDQDAECSFQPHHTADRLQKGVVVPFMIVQRWLQRVRQARLADRAALVAATNMGGDFGISGHVLAAEGGALAGLLKGLRLEASEQGWEGVRFRVVDFPHDTTPSRVAQVLCMELVADQTDIEVGYPSGVRRLVRVASRPVQPKADAQIHRRGVWVITGGARGITALVARELGRRYDLRLHLLGTTARSQMDQSWHHLSQHELQKIKEQVVRQARAERRPPAQAWAEAEKSIEINHNLQALRQAGVEATYHVCDVGQRDQLAQVIEKVRAMDGPIEGVIHGAAYVKDAWFPNKKLADVEKTLQVKVGGAAWLMELTRRDPLKYFIAFSSIAGRFGAKGQTDYGAANDMLSKLVLWYRTERPECLAVAMDWHPWADAGLATRPEIKARLESIHMDLMPAQEGIESLLDEILAGAPSGEVVVTQPEHYRTSHPLPVVADHQPPAGPTDVAPSPALDAAISQLPLVDAVIQREAGRQIVTRTKLDPASDPFLIEHRLRGKPLLPAVMALELIGQTATLLDGRQVVGFRDVQIHRGLRFTSPQPRQVEVIAELAQDGAACQLRSTLPARATGPPEAMGVHLTATALLGKSPSVPAWPFCGQPPLGWYPIHYDDKAPIYHGPKLRCVKNFFFQFDGGYAKIVAPDTHEIGGARSGAQWILPGAALDACLYTCAVFTYLMFQQRVEIPSGFDQIELYRLPSADEECVLRIYYRNRDERITTYDFVLFGNDGQALLAVQGYRSATLGKAF